MTTQFPTDAVYLRMQSYVSDKPARQQLADLLGALAQAAEHAAEDWTSRASDDEAEDMPEQAAAHRASADDAYDAIEAARQLAKELTHQESMPRFKVVATHTMIVSQSAYVEVEACDAKTAESLAREMNDFGGLNWRDNPDVDAPVQFKASPLPEREEGHTP